MFSKISIYATIALAAFATATKAPPASQCTGSTGNVQCCNGVVDAGSSSLLGIFGPVVGLALQGLGVPIGVTCTPVTVVGVGSGASCNSQAVCCSNNKFNGVINVGCTPVNIAL